ncbi:hypothetical protein RB619_18550 [Flavobacterium sp. LHD-80]|uniref:hypothetical protein n=1 Tax=Flavobacterium sp. LHD-80 TaxID=3071411 RepID=UPI0027DEDF6C|nr:hypothetical protein [Flavobacterium sp. LHD-80]MDQ6472644.1 hypothetical protein [Flavobacterium sp. LHD-80]
MNIELIQKRGLNSRKFILTKDRIIVDTKTLRKNDKYEVKLDQLGFEIHYRADSTIVGKIFFGMCICVLIALPFLYFITKQIDTGAFIINCIIWGILVLANYFKQHQDDIYLVDGQTTLVFYREIPNEKSVLEFIEKVKSNSKNYIREKYTDFDDVISDEEFYARLKWLKDKEVINSSEYKTYKANFETKRLL